VLRNAGQPVLAVMVMQDASAESRTWGPAEQEEHRYLPVEITQSQRDSDKPCTRFSRRRPRDATNSKAQHTTCYSLTGVCNLSLADDAGHLHHDGCNMQHNGVVKSCRVEPVTALLMSTQRAYSTSRNTQGVRIQLPATQGACIFNFQEHTGLLLLGKHQHDPCCSAA
jgi:hypothetical protein